jgi:hypothetical protein
LELLAKLAVEAEKLLAEVLERHFQTHQTSEMLAFGVEDSEPDTASSPVSDNMSRFVTFCIRDTYQ